MADIPTPGVTKELVEYLEKLFKNCVPTFDESNRQVWAAVGRQQIITHLRLLYNRQVQKELERQ